MVRSDQNVMDSGWYELANDGHNSLSRAGEILGLGMPAIKNQLRRQFVVFIDVDEGLVVFVIREHKRRQGNHSGSGSDAVPNVKSNRLPFLKNLGFEPFGRNWRLSGADLQALGHESV